jgi:hypothetical protein
MGWNLKISIESSGVDGLKKRMREEVAVARKHQRASVLLVWQGCHCFQMVIVLQ